MSKKIVSPNFCLGRRAKTERFKEYNGFIQTFPWRLLYPLGTNRDLQEKISTCSLIT